MVQTMFINVHINLYA